MTVKSILCGLALFGAVLVTPLSMAQAPTPGAAPPPAQAAGPQQPRPGSLQVARDVVYKQEGRRALRLDLYTRVTPDNVRLPVVIWFHGAGGLANNKNWTPAARLVAAGYAVASVEYSSDAFPAPLHDAKAAVRWLRANAEKYKLDAAHIGAWGVSEGGDLAALLGATGDVKELEGGGANLEQSSRIQAVADFSGPQGVAGIGLRSGGVSVGSVNPVDYVSADDAPFFIVHGSADSIVSPMQSQLLQTALKRAGVENDVEYVPGAGHLIAQTQTPAIAEAVTRFFDKHLRNGQHQRDDLENINQPADAWIDAYAVEMPGTQYKLFDTPSRGPNTQASYRIYLPPGYDDAANAGRSYPVIYYMHGLNEDSWKSNNAGYVQRLDVAVRSGVMPPTIVVLVQGLNRGFYVDLIDGKFPIETVFIKDLIPHVDKTYRTVRRREGRAMEGHSMGGAGALHMAFKYPELFGSVSSFAAALVQLGATPASLKNTADTYYGGDVARMAAEMPWTLAAKNLSKIKGRMFVRLICGDKDNLLAVNERMSNVLDDLSITHEFIVSKGAPHSVKEVIARLDQSPFPYYAKVFADVR